MCASVPRAQRVPRLDQLSLDEKIGQMFVYGARGGVMNESSASYRWLLHQVHDNHIGGVVWFPAEISLTGRLSPPPQGEGRGSPLPTSPTPVGGGGGFSSPPPLPAP